MNKMLWGLINDAVCLAVVTIAIGIGLWYWGYWVGKNDTMATQSIVKEARK
jgi:hypothetical protein